MHPTDREIDLDDALAREARRRAIAHWNGLSVDDQLRTDFAGLVELYRAKIAATTTTPTGESNVPSTR